MPKLTSRGRVTIPIKVRSALGLRPGDHLDFVELEKGEFTIIAADRSVQELTGLFKGRCKRAVTLEEMDAAIARGASRSK
jgi:antitoxin PrlF